jgi:type IV pilus assembly protein PilA
MKDQKDRKGMNNTGFSFVELIIAIAILAIMAGVLAPQLIKYIDSSRKSTDVQNAQAIATAVNIALADEDAYNAAKPADGAVKRYKVDELTGTPPEGGGSLVQDDFQKKVVEILGTNLPEPKFNSSTNKDFVIIIKNKDSILSFYIYPYSGSDVLDPETDTANQLYPNVGDNYTK